MKYIILLIVLIFYKSTFSQDFWEQLYFPDSTSIYCIAINDNGDLFVGTGNDGNPGGVYRSIDTGVSWDLVLNTGTFPVQEIAISESGNIYIGRSGASDFMESEDNGNSWEDIPLPWPSDVTAILPVGEDTIYLGTVGWSNAVLNRSTDNGMSWDTLFIIENYTSGSITDIIISDESIIYISLKGYFPGMGGVYKSEDNGITWELTGLFDHMITSLALNSSNDLFAGSWGGTEFYYAGLYVLRNSLENWDTLIHGPQVSDLVINCEDGIYFSSAWPNGVVRSLDDGGTFELVNEGLPEGIKDYIEIDKDGYLYVIDITSLSRSINPTVSIWETPISYNPNQYAIYPNPTIRFLNVKAINEFATSELFEVNIFNSIGELLFSKDNLISTEPNQFDVRSLRSGLYLIEITHNNHKTITKFIKH